MRAISSAISEYRIPGAGFCQNLLVLFPRQQAAFVEGFDADGRLAGFREIVLNLLDYCLLGSRKVVGISETEAYLVAFLKQWIVYELEIAVGYGEFKDIQLLLVVGKNEGGDLLGDVFRERFALDFNQKDGLEIVLDHENSGGCSELPTGMGAEMSREDVFLGKTMKDAINAREKNYDF